MFIDKDSIVINGTSMGQYLVEAKYGYNKLWASDSGRNLAGKMTGSLVGIFPKLILQFRALTRSELELLIPIFDASSQQTTYYDPNKKEYITMTTYSGDYEITNTRIIKNDTKNDGFSISFISTERRR